MFHSDLRCEEGLEVGKRLIKPDEPTIPFEGVETNWNEVNNFIRKDRGRSAPGPNGIPYKVPKDSKDESTYTGHR